MAFSKHDSYGVKIANVNYHIKYNAIHDSGRNSALLMGNTVEFRSKASVTCNLYSAPEERTLTRDTGWGEIKDRGKLRPFT